VGGDDKGGCLGMKEGRVGGDDRGGCLGRKEGWEGMIEGAV